MKFEESPSNNYTIWITGLSGAGKTTLAKSLQQKLQEEFKRIVVIDGDDFRNQYAQDLGFSMADREENNRRAAILAKKFNTKGYVCICAFISPTHAIRQLCKSIISPEKFIEVFLDVPISTCIKRDSKKLYAKAKEGKISDFTGISSPYEAPLYSNLILDGNLNLETNIDRIYDYLLKHNLKINRRIQTGPKDEVKTTGLR